MNKFETGGRKDFPNKPSMDTRYIPPVIGESEYPLRLQASMDGLPQDKNPQRSRLPETGLVEPVRPASVSFFKDTERKLPGEEREKSVDKPHGDIEKTEKTTLAERHPDWPKINATFYFAPHGTAEDMKDLASHMQNADVYFYEGTEGNGNVPLYQAIASADPQIYPSSELENFVDTATFGSDGHPVKGSPIEAIARSLYTSNVKVEHCDLMPGDEVTNEKLNQSANKTYLSVSFEQTLDNLGGKIEEYSRLQEKRENIIPDRLEARLETLIDTDPDLKDKEINVLLSIGAAHTTLRHKLEAMGIDTKSEFPSKPYVYSYWNQVERAFMYKKTPGKEALSRAYVSDMLADRLGSIKSQNSDIYIKYIRDLATQFTMDEIKTLHEKNIVSSEGRDQMLDRMISDKGLGELPKDYAELNALVKKQAQEEKEASEARLAEYRRTHVSE